MDTEELEALDLLYKSPVDVEGGELGPPFLVVHNQLLYLVDIEEEVVALAPHCQVSDLLPVGRLIGIGDQAYHRCVISKRNDDIGVVHYHTVMGEQGVQDGTKPAPDGPLC